METRNVRVQSLVEASAASVQVQSRLREKSMSFYEPKLHGVPGKRRSTVHKATSFRNPTRRIGSPLLHVDRKHSALGRKLLRSALTDSGRSFSIQRDFLAEEDAQEDDIGEDERHLRHDPNKSLEAAKDPSELWARVRRQHFVQKIPMSNTSLEQRPETVRFVCISDTHTYHGKMPHVPDGDVLVHAGDFSMSGDVQSLFQFSRWFKSLPHRHKIVIAGNHDTTLDKAYYARNWKRFHQRMESTAQADAIVRNNPDFVYLEDSSVRVGGYKIYGTPWQPTFCNWAFNRERGPEIASKWAQIPTDTDILVVHGPPLGYGDEIHAGVHTGCYDLLQTIQGRVQPRYVVFGHIHEGFGKYFDGRTTYCNASSCTVDYKPSNPPMVFDLPLLEPLE